MEEASWRGAATRFVDNAVVAQFVKFAAAGVLGFLVNLAAVYSLKGAVGLYWAGAIAFIAAATATWLVNRRWTFRDHARAAASRQWVAYLGTNLVGFGLYYATYAASIALVPLCARLPVLAVGAGSAAGLFANFTLSRRIVFS